MYLLITFDGQEIDLVEEAEGKLLGLEVKYSPAAKIKKKNAFTTTYENASIELVNKENYLEYIL
ncbi:hypothetical protein [Ignavibacterium sp.]|uniref:hypothetical protein n=1 Tax=Ignavibacterium sp. TaxID=2651167 RepID=UPI00307EA3BC